MSIKHHGQQDFEFGRFCEIIFERTKKEVKKYMSEEFIKFSETVLQLSEKMNPCVLCPRQCRVYRSRGQIGFCGINDKPLVSSVGPHFGEESVLVGTGGSGTIFFAGCNLGCIFCQNYDISHYKTGSKATIEQLAQYMLSLQKMGCENINLVTPTHTIPAIIAAIEIAKNGGLKLPIVYNSGGYDSVETLKIIEGFIDIYMPDMKFSDSQVSKQLCNAEDYPQVNKDAVLEMHRQVGDLVIKNGVAVKGLLIRHLVLPNNMAGSFEIIDFLVEKVSRKTAINVMNQYRPCFKAADYPQINRRATNQEIDAVKNHAAQKSLTVID
jgi:putative pyruvate formate lyase activating enzyme